MKNEVFNPDDWGMPSASEKDAAVQVPELVPELVEGREGPSVAASSTPPERGVPRSGGGVRNPVSTPARTTKTYPPCNRLLTSSYNSL